MSVGWMDLVGWAAVFAVAAWIAFPTKAAVEKAVKQFVWDNVVYIDGEFGAAFRRELVLERRVNAAVLLGVFALTWSTRGVVAFGGWEIVSVAVAAGAVVASVFRLVRAGHEFRAQAGRPAVARTRAVRASDYVHPSTWAIGGGIVVVLLAISAKAARLSIDRGSSEVTASEAFTVAIAAAIVAVVGPLGFWFLYALCRRPEPAVDAPHLYFQDAWRAHSVMASIMLWVLAAALAAAPAFSLAPDWLVTGALLAAVPVGFWADRRADLWFRERLWPNLQTRELVGPGDMMPGRAS